MIIKILNKPRLICTFLTIFFMLSWCELFAETGHELWLNYKSVEDNVLREQYSKYFANVSICKNKFSSQIESELNRSVAIMLSKKIIYSPTFNGDGIIFTDNTAYGIIKSKLGFLDNEGYRIRQINDSGRKLIVVQADSDPGFLYATFHLLRLMQTGKSFDNLDITEVPKLNVRVLNHWGTLDDSNDNCFWKWDELPNVLDIKYEDYARANASIGINGVVLNNPTAEPKMLREDYLMKVVAIANMLRKYNIRVYLSANFACPLKPSDTPDVKRKWGGIGNLETADPLNANVIKWWDDKVKQIYSQISDFGGFLVKANSENMSGPLDYKRDRKSTRLNSSH